MDNIIGALATILAAIVVWSIDRYLVFDKPIKYEKVSKAIKEAVSGKWTGTFEQNLKNTQIVVPVDLVLKVSKSGKIIGEANFSVNNESYKMNVSGGFYLLHFLKMEYSNAKRATRQFGSFVFELSPDSKELEGCFVGYGDKNRKVISGPVRFAKIDDFNL